MAKSIKINTELWQRVEQHAKRAGYSSPEEFVEHVLEKAVAGDEVEDEVGRRLKGLGYLE
jgi:hypothetical protein